MCWADAGDVGVILGLCVLILNSRAAKLISQLIGCVFRFHDSSFPFSAFISELYFNHVFEYFRRTGLFKNSRTGCLFRLPPTLQLWWSFICHSLQHKSNIFPGTDNLQKLERGPDKSEFFVLQFIQPCFIIQILKIVPSQNRESKASGDY